MCVLCIQSNSTWTYYRCIVIVINNSLPRSICHFEPYLNVVPGHFDIPSIPFVYFHLGFICSIQEYLLFCLIFVLLLAKFNSIRFEDKIIMVPIILIAPHNPSRLPWIWRRVLPQLLLCLDLQIHFYTFISLSC